MAYNAIDLYYIDGISRENTPYFASLNDQATYYATKKFATIDNSYYVPHYQDKIKIDTEDVSIFNKVNYLSITYGNKKFYYFIDSVEYISEDVIELSISLDSVQTFMFNIIYHDGIVERMHIDRWIYDSANQSYKINRDYIRENLSYGVWSEPDYEYITLASFGFVIAQSNYHSDIPSTLLDNIKFHYFNNTNSSDIVKDTSIKYYVPFSNTDTEITQILKGSHSTGDDYYGYNFYCAVAGLMGDQLIESIMYIPFNPFKGVTRSVNTLYVDYNDVGGMKTIQIANTNVKGYAIEINNTSTNYDVPNINVIVEFKDYDYITLGNVNTSKNATFDSSFEPSMLDENYFRVNFGERSYSASFPLFYTTSRTLYLRYTADIATGKRLYGITDIKGDSVFSKGGIVITAQPIYLTKINDTWLNWQAQNRATIPMAMANFFVQGIAVGAAYSGALGMLGAQESNYYKFLQSDYARASGMKASPYQQLLFSAERNQIDATAESRIIGHSTSLAQVATSEYNAWLAPDSIKQLSDFVPDFYTGSFKNVYYELRVNDYDQCAFYYFKFGNKVDKPFYLNHPYNLFTQMKTRYRFNYFKFQHIDLDLDMLCAESMINDLKLRLLTGVRQWYLDHGDMCTYLLDNVEESLRTD